jgi:glycosyltransferase involved in cell wall biosynthesis
MVGNFLSDSLGTRSVCEDLADRLATAGWCVLTVSNKKQRVWRLLDMVLTTYCRKMEYGVAQVDVYSGKAFFWAEAVCCVLDRMGKPYVLTLHGGNLPLFANPRPTRVRRLLQSAAAVTTPSPYLLEKMKTYRPDLLLVPNALEISTYKFRLRKKSRPSLIWLRAFHSIYNPSLAPKVLGLLGEDFPDINLTMVGPDKGDGSLQAMLRTAHELGIADRIMIPGKVPKSEISDWMGKANIFLNTTMVDNTPVSVLEAMACGLCVVSTDVGGISYLLEHEQDALLVPSDNPTAMANAVRRILSDQVLEERLSRNARKKAERFDWRAILPEWEELLKSVAERH